MLRVADQYAGTDTGRQRRANEDSLLARSPLFVVADGMGGAQAGEVASRIAVESFRHGLDDASRPEAALATLALAANSRIHELSHSNAEHAGMGTTLTAVYVGDREVAIAHVGDSRAYCLRDGELLRLTDDHSLVDELMRQGRLTPEEAVEHPQRSVITRALGPEGTVEVDTRSFRARPGDVYLLCSDGLTTMLSEEEIADALRSHPRLRDAGEALIAAANEAGGRDNITVVLLRLEEVGAGSPHPLDGEEPDEHATLLGVPAVAPPVTPRRPRRPDGAASRACSAPGARRRRLRRAGALAAALVVLALIASGGYLALQSVYFIGTNDRGLVTLYQGVPFRLPGNLALYSSRYVSGVGASTLTPQRRQTLLDHSLRSESNAGSLIRTLELGQLE
ncbi:MAG TPA: Stp1/IreP family PP2C-type Ser/Thr phosphatase [Solirubrobacteraceae bacterium]|jgi:protein phosphatase|nr:Stp1/IreP family PP2C-type Ser/Thr phosphatase [Solirubrobacteraceae bacterium]